ncbi:hypothetical protein [Blastococcus sp. TF02A-35]|uniref:hypothetical protein n=1 Tax=Blastococcus sp. TF02A-35 TaxID=2559612 RepID=UPI0010733A0F|nr:hypothetical protein [Blastococcus sp. TF02A_35]TFV52657.1 hypothetical protein E4P43_04985 [Blastococcus sp. TF02A_35]
MTMPALPAQPLTAPTEVDVTDEVAFRRYVAEHVAAQTLAMQRTEWYLKSVRLMIMIMLGLLIASIVIGFVFGIIAATAEERADSLVG